MFEHLDDAGKVEHENCTVTITGKSELLTKSYNNYKLLKALPGENNLHFQKYIPHNIEKISSDVLKITFYEKAYPLHYVFQKLNNKLDQVHVNWILSRILELATWLSKNNFVHAGLSLDNLYIIPRNHGLVCISFYHLTKINAPLKSISGRNVNLYPALNLVKKIASSNIDIVAAKRIAMFLMGDKTSLGDSFVKNVHYNDSLIEFLRTEEHDAHAAYRKYRDILSRFYNTKIFHELKFENQ